MRIFRFKEFNVINDRCLVGCKFTKASPATVFTTIHNICTVEYCTDEYTQFEI